MTKEEIYHYFNEMVISKDIEKVSYFNYLDFSSLSIEEVTELYIKLLDENWHYSHEDIALHFQHTRNPLATEILFKTATRNDIKQFDYKPLSRKCVWALADIGTEKAKQYITTLSLCGDTVIEEFAKKRLENWEDEIDRKGQRISSDDNFDLFIRLENFKNATERLPNKGQQIIGYTFELMKDEISKDGKQIIGESKEEYIVVYQAYKPSIAKFAVKNQYLGGQDFSYKRMSWIKPNFLWMMYRCGWAKKENQERVLAIWITKSDFEEILKQAAFSSFNPKYFLNEQDWKNELEIKKVRLQWDPDHDPYGIKLERRAIQLGLKDEVLEKFGKQQIKYIMDITDFVKEQKYYVDKNQLDKLLVPVENIVRLENKELESKIGIE